MREAPTWRVSTHSAGTGNCVEVGQSADAILIRDTKNREAGTLIVSQSSWQAFLGDLPTSVRT